MKWTEIVIKTSREAYDAISDMLISIGSGGVAVQDPCDIMEKVSYQSSITGNSSAGDSLSTELSGKSLSGTIDEYIDEKLLDEINGMGQDTVILKAYFPESTNSVELMQLIKEKLCDISRYLHVGDLKIESSEVKDEDWSNNWKKYYKTFNITKKIVIKPSWEDFNNEEGKIIIEMDPGMAFGTGTHETTKMCANLIEKYINKGDKVLDVGSGSGILTIIAAKLGAKKVLALDIDKEAVKVTINNCRQNGIMDRVVAFQGILGDMESFEAPLYKEEIKDFIENGKADLITANIIASVIIDLSDKVLQYLRPGGIFVTSGIIKSKKEMVLDRYIKNKFECLEVIEDGEWVAIVFKCPDSL